MDWRHIQCVNNHCAKFMLVFRGQIPDRRAGEPSVPLMPPPPAAVRVSSENRLPPQNPNQQKQCPKTSLSSLASLRGLPASYLPRTAANRQKQCPDTLLSPPRPLFAASCLRAVYPADVFVVLPPAAAAVRVSSEIKCINTCIQS